MICRYCGKASAEGLKYCSNCGANLMDSIGQTTSYQPMGSGYMTEEEIYEEKMAKKRRNRRHNIIALIVLAVLVAVVVCVVKYISADAYRIKHTEPSEYPGQEWGDTLEKVCDESSWEGKKEDGERMVIYTGKIKSSGKNVEIIFEINDKGDSYRLKHIKVDGARIYNERKFVDDLFKRNLAEY